MSVVIRRDPIQSIGIEFIVFSCIRFLVLFGLEGLVLVLPFLSQLACGRFPFLVGLEGFKFLARGNFHGRFAFKIAQRSQEFVGGNRGTFHPWRLVEETVFPAFGCVLFGSKAELPGLG